MSQIESVEFEAEMSVFSGFNSFLTGLQTDETVKNLIDETGQSLKNKEAVLGRLMALLDDSGDQNYAHPHDVALAAYLYALNQSEPDLAQTAVQKILKTPKLWWTARLAHHIQEIGKVQPLKSFSS